MRRTAILALSVCSVTFGVALACGDVDDSSHPEPSVDGGSRDAKSEDAPHPRDAANEASDAGDAGTVTFAVDMMKGPTRQFQPSATPQRVSEYVYGINGAIDGNAASAYFTASRTRWGFVRQGGDSFTAWNWTNNYTNSASDYCFQQSAGNGGTSLAGVITSHGDTIPAAQAQKEAFLATVPIVDYVSAAYDNANPSCPATASDCAGGTTSSTRVNPANLPFASADGGSPAFVPNAPSKPDGGFCTCPLAGACDGGCAVSASPVYQDEFVNYLKVAYGDGGAPVFFDLDNEPNYWGGTHPELWPFQGTLPCQTYTVTYDDIVNRNTVYATSVKAVWPDAKVFGPVVAGDGLIYGHTYTDPPQPSEFLDYYLAQMAAAAVTAGKPLIDVLDVHYYSNALTTGAPPSDAQCMQSPRLFWDPNYTSLSPDDTAELDFEWTGVNDYFNREWYPRKLIPRILGKIAAAYSGSGATAPGLSITEYNNGCETDIAGGVAQADVLGVFGREGMFAAAAFPLHGLWNNYLVASFDLYRNYDGKSSVVGDTAVQATASDAVDTSIYAFSHSDDASALDLVVLNKTNEPQTATIRVAEAPALTHALAYQLVDGAAVVVPVPSSTAVSCSGGTCTLTYTMPPTSATTLVLRPGANGGNASPSYTKVDDMEKGTAGPIELSIPAPLSPGDWFNYVSPGSAANSILPSPFAYATLTAPHVTMPGVSSAHAAHTQCSLNGTSEVCQMGFGIAGDASSGTWQPQTIDWSSYAGITFWGRSDSSSLVNVMFPDVDTLPNGDRCGQTDAAAAQCYDHFEQQESFTTDWQRYTVYFSELHQDGAPFAWGYSPQSGAFDPTKVYQVLFSVPGPSSAGAAPVDADIWIDDLYLIRN